MRRRTMLLTAAAITLLLYVGIAWFASGIDIPPGVPTARASWLWPFRVMAALGFAIASLVGISHLAGDLLAAVVLGGVLGAAFALTRRMLA